MIIVKDKHRTLNLNHLAIYIMLSKEEKSRYGDTLSGIITDRTVTKGLFQFYIIEKGNTPYEELPRDMTRATSMCNVMVRLVNSIHQTYCYGLDCIDFGNGADSIRTELNSFVKSVCEENVMQLEILEERQTNSAIAARQTYEDEAIVKGMFEDALADVICQERDAPSALERIYSSTDLETSLEIVLGALGPKLSRKVGMEYYEREKPLERPDISIQITKVPTGGKTKKDGTEKTGWGFDICINGTHIPVHFGSNDQTFLYAALLFASRDGIALGRKDFRNIASTKAQIWLHSKYRAFCFATDFCVWYNTVQTGNAHRIDDAVSKIKGTLWDILSVVSKRAYYYLCVVTKDESYKVRLNEDRIIIDTMLIKRMAKA